MMCDEVLRPVGRAGFLVGTEEEREVNRRTHLALHEGAGNQQTRHDGLLVVLDAASDEPAALDAEFEGVRGPERALAGRNDVEVRHDPEGSRRPRTAVSRDDVGPNATLGASVRCVEARHLVEGKVLQHPFEPHRLVVLPFAATLGTHRGDRRQPALQLHRPLTVPFDSPQQLVHCHGPLSPRDQAAPVFRRAKVLDDGGPCHVACIRPPFSAIRCRRLGTRRGSVVQG